MYLHYAIKKSDMSTVSSLFQCCGNTFPFSTNSFNIICLKRFIERIYWICGVYRVCWVLRSLDSLHSLPPSPNYFYLIRLRRTRGMTKVYSLWSIVYGLLNKSTLDISCPIVRFDPDYLF